jgi:hypothetical protein
MFVRNFAFFFGRKREWTLNSQSQAFLFFFASANASRQQCVNDLFVGGKINVGNCEEKITERENSKEVNRENITRYKDINKN